MFEKLEKLKNQYEELCARMARPEVYSDAAAFAACDREAREIAPIVEAYRAYSAACDDMDAALELGDEEEYRAAKAEREAREDEIRLLLLPKDPNDGKNVIMEIRGGFKEISFVVEGEGAWSRLKFEAGGHRVQRVPVTESGGRIHTSAATVAVLPEIGEVEFRLDPNDLKIDTYRSSGAGGQHVNKTESAIRITHLPTGTVVECQDERSQYKNKDRAMQILRARLYEAEQEKQRASVAQERRSQIGSGDRSERIRTYNFPQNRVTDHRLSGEGRSFNIDSIMDGDLDGLIDALVTADQAAKLAAQA